MPEKQPILITGISSDLMQRVVQLLDLSAVDVCGISRSAEDLDLPGVRLVSADIRDPDTYQAYVKKGSWIIHAAAITHTRDEQAYYKTNVEATQTLVDLAKEREVSKFIFISSRTAGKTSGAYGVSKLQAEQIIQKHLTNWSIIRPAEVFGSASNEGIEGFLNQALRKRVVFYPAKVPSKMVPIHIQDVAQNLCDLLFTEALNQMIPFHGPEAFSFPDLLAVCASVRSQQLVPVPIPRWAMERIAQTLKTLKWNAGVVPDQIHRLYSLKNDTPCDKNLRRLSDYILVNSSEDRNIHG